MPDPVVNVTLVHGTHARKTRWIGKDSEMTSAITSKGLTAGVFLWSGHNSHKARIRAAEKLAEHLRQQREVDPGVRQAIVAHSHGGNIAAHAVWRLLGVTNG